jgi:hypothetical protein
MEGNELDQIASSKLKVRENDISKGKFSIDRII